MTPEQIKYIANNVECNGNLLEVHFLYCKNTDRFFVPKILGIISTQELLLRLITHFRVINVEEYNNKYIITIDDECETAAEKIDMFEFVQKYK